MNCHLATHLSEICGLFVFPRPMSHVGLITETTVEESRKAAASVPGEHLSARLRKEQHLPAISEDALISFW